MLPCHLTIGREVTHLTSVLILLHPTFQFTQCNLVPFHIAVSCFTFIADPILAFPTVPSVGFRLNPGGVPTKTSLGISLACSPHR